MVDNNEGLLREVEEELRRERLQNLWQQYGTLLIAGAALLVAGVGGWKYWQNTQIQAAQSAGMSYEGAMASLANGKTEDSLKVFENLAGSGQAGYKSLASLQAAGALLKQGKTSEAKAAFEKIAADRGTDSILQDYATLQAVALNIGDADLSKVQNRLNRLLAESSPWRANARELVALAAFQGQEYDIAKENLRAIVADPKAAQGTIERANTLLASIAAIEVAKKGVVTAPEQKTGAAAPEAATGKETATAAAVAEKADRDKVDPDKATAGASNESAAKSENKDE